MDGGDAGAFRTGGTVKGCTFSFEEDFYIASCANSKLDDGNCDRVEVRYDRTEGCRGKGLYAKVDIPEGGEILRERALALCPNVDRSDIPTCADCLYALESPLDTLTRLGPHEKWDPERPWPPRDLPCIKEFPTPPRILCSNPACTLIFCSDKCSARAHRRWHSPICAATVGGAECPVTQWRNRQWFVCGIDHRDTFALLLVLYGTIVSSPSYAAARAAAAVAESQGASASEAAACVVRAIYGAGGCGCGRWCGGVGRQDGESLSPGSDQPQSSTGGSTSVSQNFSQRGGGDGGAASPPGGAEGGRGGEERATPPPLPAALFLARTPLTSFTFSYLLEAHGTTVDDYDSVETAVGVATSLLWRIFDPPAVMRGGLEEDGGTTTVGKREEDGVGAVAGGDGDVEKGTEPKGGTVGPPSDRGVEAEGLGNGGVRQDDEAHAKIPHSAVDPPCYAWFSERFLSLLAGAVILNGQERAPNAPIHRWYGRLPERDQVPMARLLGWGGVPVKKAGGVGGGGGGGSDPSSAPPPSTDAAANVPTTTPLTWRHPSLLYVVRGQGIYTIHANSNHSCTPNATVVNARHSREHLMMIATRVEDEEVGGEASGGPPVAPPSPPAGGGSTIEGVKRTPPRAGSRSSTPPSAGGGASRGAPPRRRVVGGIEAGDEVCISYVDGGGDVERRRRELREHYQFWCRCIKCIREGGGEGC